MIFFQENYDKKNEWGISKVKQYLLSNGYKIIPKSEEDYGIDVIATKDNKIEYYEAEIKTKYEWTNKENFRFNTVSFLGRKSKWSHIGFWYMIICRETSAYIKCHSSAIFQDKFKKTIELKNKWSRGGLETFYRIPKDLCEWGTIG